MVLFVTSNEFVLLSTFDFTRLFINLTIAVAAIDGNGIVAPYSVQGSNLLVSAFGDGDPDQGIDGTIVSVYPLYTCLNRIRNKLKSLEVTSKKKTRIEYHKQVIESRRAFLECGIFFY